MKNLSSPIIFLIVINFQFSLKLFGQTHTWIQNSFDDFTEGICSASGIDLYVTNNGTIKSINRYDLNDDGFLDLVFNTGHELKDAVSPTLYNWQGDRKGTIRELPVDGSKQISIGDLNNDGFQDVVFLPNENGVSPRRYLSILWGNENGWSNFRKTQLITIAPKKMEISDMNGDSWSELLILNGSRWSPLDGPEQVLRWYWGSEKGFQQNEYREFLLENAVDFIVRDLDNNGIPDLIVLLTDPGRIWIYWNPGLESQSLSLKPEEIDLGSSSAGNIILADYSKKGGLDILVTGGEKELIDEDPTTGEKRYLFSGIIFLESIGNGVPLWKSPEIIKAPPASDIKIADLDLDGHLDIVLADVSAENNSVHILWGNNDSSINHLSHTSLPISFAAAIDIDDIDGDSYPDIAVGVYRSEKTYDSESVICFGDSNRKFNIDNHSIPSAGASDILIVPQDEHEPTKILVANTRSGRYLEDTPTKVYWGSADGFDPEDVSLFDIRSGYTAAAADLNNDGYTDLVLLSIVHAIRETHPGIGFNILWGGPDGLKNERRTVLNEYGLYDISIADINKDGFLDLIGSVGYRSPDGDPPGVVVWFGSENGFSSDHKMRIETEARPTQHILADFNKDGFLDIALLIGNKHKISIIWGDEGGFSNEGITTWPFLRGGDMKTADLNGDGWLDIVVSSLLIPNSLFYDFGTYVFWGSSEGFDPARAQKLTGHGTVGITIADWDRDGFPDIFLPSYKYAETREAVGAHLYWGQKTGFSDILRTDFLQNSGHGAMAGDFNGDGIMDLAVSNHRTNGDHATYSQIIYGKSNRFKDIEVQLLPTIGSEFIYSNDMGAQYDRSFKKSYESKEFEWDESLTSGGIIIESKTPGNSELEVFIRTSSTKDSLTSETWRKIEFDDFMLLPSDRFLQYRLIFISDNGDRYPEVNRVELTLYNK